VSWSAGDVTRQLQPLDLDGSVPPSGEPPSGGSPAARNQT